MAGRELTPLEFREPRLARHATVVPASQGPMPMLCRATPCLHHGHDLLVHGHRRRCLVAKGEGERKERERGRKKGQNDISPLFSPSKQKK